MNIYRVNVNFSNDKIVRYFYSLNEATQYSRRYFKEKFPNNYYSIIDTISYTSTEQYEVDGAKRKSRTIIKGTADYIDISELVFSDEITGYTFSKKIQEMKNSVISLPLNNRAYTMSMCNHVRDEINVSVWKEVKSKMDKYLTTYADTLSDTDKKSIKDTMNHIYYTIDYVHGNIPSQYYQNKHKIEFKDPTSCKVVLTIETNVQSYGRGKLLIKKGRDVLYTGKIDGAKDLVISEGNFNAIRYTISKTFGVRNIFSFLNCILAGIDIDKRKIFLEVEENKRKRARV